jgi:GNAT superfamily N-acetyltransferase
MFKRAAERVVALEWGSAIFNDSFPLWPDLNTIRVELPAPGLDAGRLERAVLRLQRGLPVKRVEVFDEATAEALVPAMAARGWETPRSVLMGWDGGEPPAAPAVEEVPYPAVERLRGEWLRGDHLPGGEAAVAQGLAADRLTFSTTPTRAFAAVRQGRLVAYGLLLDMGEAALVEDVYTTPGARRGGLGEAVVHRLVWESRAGGHADTVLATDSAGRARDLYARLGFTRLGAVQRFVKAEGAGYSTVRRPPA